MPDDRKDVKVETDVGCGVVIFFILAACSGFGPALIETLKALTHWLKTH